MTGRPHFAVRWRGTLALGAAAVAAAGLLQHRMAGLFEPPASYTTLAFQHPQSLPKQLSAPRADAVISFEIRNVGGTARAYQWTVLLVQGTFTQRVATGNVSLRPGRGTVIARTVQIACTQGQVRMAVSLARPAESIDALAACQSPATRRP